MLNESSYNSLQLLTYINKPVHNLSYFDLTTSLAWQQSVNSANEFEAGNVYLTFVFHCRCKIHFWWISYQVFVSAHLKQETNRIDIVHFIVHFEQHWLNSVYMHSLVTHLPLHEKNLQLSAERSALISLYTASGGGLYSKWVKSTLAYPASVTFNNEKHERHNVLWSLCITCRVSGRKTTASNMCDNNIVIVPTQAEGFILNAKACLKFTVSKQD